MGIRYLLEKLIKEMRQRPNLTIAIFVFIFVLIRELDRAKGDLKTQPSMPPSPIFNVSDFVNEIHLGSLKERDSLLQSSEVSFVFYYAPWCYLSLQAATHFAEAARKFHDEISFIAINCWWTKGECREKSQGLSFPSLYLHHRNYKDSVQYNGPHVYSYYDIFLMRALNPVVYLGTSRDVGQFIQSSQISVIGSFSSSTGMLRKFTEIALISLEHYPVRLVKYGFVLSKHLSRELELREKVLKLYDQTISLVYATQELMISSYTTPGEVVEWSLKRPMALHQVLSVGKKSNDLHKVLKNGPSLLTFIFDFSHLDMISKVAVRYNRLTELHCHCCKSISAPKTYSICLKDSHTITSSLSCELADVMIERFRFHSSFNLPPCGACSTTRPIYNPAQSRLEVCTYRDAFMPSPNHTSIEGIKYKTNETLSFVAMDLNLTSGIAEALGFSSQLRTPPYTVILDLPQEQKYVMNANFTMKNVENFILNFTNRELVPSLTTNKWDSHDNMYTLRMKNNDVFIPKISSNTFEELVLRSSKDVLVYYHSSWCGGCSAYSHALMTLQSKKESLKNLKIYQANEQTNKELPCSFQALSYPTLILFPGRRTGDSVVFSPSVPCTLPNLVGFLLRSASPQTKAQLLLSTCSFNQANGERIILPHKICRKQKLMNRINLKVLALKRLKHFAWRVSNSLLRRRHHQLGSRFTAVNACKQTEDLQKKQKKIMTKFRHINAIVESLTFVLNSIS